MRAPAHLPNSDSGFKMKAELQKFFKLFEELEEAGETASLTLVTKGGKSTIKLQLESSPSLPSTSTSTTTQPLPPASGRRRRHCGARARARCNQRAAAHQTSLAEAASGASLHYAAIVAIRG